MIRAGWAVAAWLMVGCSGDSKTECSCLDPSIHVHVPADRAAAVVDVLPGGSACAGASATCAAGLAGGGCVDYSFRARSAGKCHVDVDFSSGPARFSADLDIVADACCGGFYANPISAGDVEVPEPITADAGAGG